MMIRSRSSRGTASQPPGGVRPSRARAASRGSIGSFGDGNGQRGLYTDAAYF